MNHSSGIRRKALAQHLQIGAKGNLPVKGVNEKKKAETNVDRPFEKC